MRDVVVCLALLSVFVMHQWVSSGAHQAFLGSPGPVNGAPRLTGKFFGRRGLNPNVNHLLFGRRSNRADAAAAAVKATEEEEEADDRQLTQGAAMLMRMRNDLLRSIDGDDDDDDLEKF